MVAGAGGMRKAAAPAAKEVLVHVKGAYRLAKVVKSRRICAYGGGNPLMA